MERGNRNTREADRDRRAPRRARTREPQSFEDQESDNEEAPYSDQEQQSTRGHQHSSPRIETRTVRFKNSQHESNQHESEDRELEDLVFRLYELPVRGPEYASLYARCDRHFPDAMRSIPPP